MSAASVECPRCGAEVSARAGGDTCPACGHLVRCCAGCGDLIPAQPQERCPNPECRARLLYLPISGGQPVRVLHRFAELAHQGVTYRVEGILSQPNDGTTLYRLRAIDERAFRRRYHEAPPSGAGGHALALKEMALECRGAPAGSNTPAEQFEAVMARVASLRHPAIVRTYAAWQEDGRRCVLMQALEGRSIREEFLNGSQPGSGASLGTLRQAARSLAQAMEYLHRQGIWHRDITPSNVLWHRNAPVIVDFGSAVLAGAPDGGRTPLTHHYAPAEMYADSRLAVDARTDQYLLGSLLLCTAWGVPGDYYLERVGLHAVVPAPERQRALAREEGDPQRRTGFYRPDLPPAFSTAIDRLMAVRPSDRFPDDAAVSRALAGRGGGVADAARGWPARLLVLAALSGSVWLGVDVSPGVRAERHLREAARLVGSGQGAEARAAREEARESIAEHRPGLWEGRIAAARLAYGQACLDAGWRALNRGDSCEGGRLAREALLMLGAGNSRSARELLRRCRTLCPEGEP
ncbi:MAG: protein kinase [Armatimonadetes bacterium]|nr:protein kinase [Armatimonadota bacterium]